MDQLNKFVNQCISLFFAIFFFFVSSEDLFEGCLTELLRNFGFVDDRGVQLEVHLAVGVADDVGDERSDLVFVDIDVFGLLLDGGEHQ